MKFTEFTVPCMKCMHFQYIITLRNSTQTAPCCLALLYCSPVLHVYMNRAYSTGVQIVSCTLSDDSVLSESTGLFNPVLCVSQLNFF